MEHGVDDIKMAHNLYDYFVIQRYSLATSSDEADELNYVFNERAKDGWRLIHIIPHKDTHEIFVYEREKRDGQDQTS